MNENKIVVNGKECLLFVFPDEDGFHNVKAIPVGSPILERLENEGEHDGRSGGYYVSDELHDELELESVNLDYEGIFKSEE